MKFWAYPLLASLFTLSSAAALFGDVVSQVSVADNVANAYPTQTVTGALSAAASVSSRSNLASANAALNLNPGLLSTFQFADAATANAGSQSTVSFDNSFVVTGGTGTGYLALTYNNSGSGFSDAQASANATLTVLENGTTLYNARVCASTGGGQPANFSCNNQISFGFTFTYGQAFELMPRFGANAGGGLGGSNIGGGGTLSYALLSAAGDSPVPGALTLVPEPTSEMLFLFGAGLFGIGILCLPDRRMRQPTRVQPQSKEDMVPFS